MIDPSPSLIIVEAGRVRWHGAAPARCTGPEGDAWLLFSDGSATPDALARAFAEQGAHLARGVLGQFWAVLCRERDGRTILAHDGLGLSPLFFAALRGDAPALVASPSLGRIAGHLREAARAPLGIDRVYFAEVLARQNLLSLRTPYAGVRRLALGRCVVWEAGHERSEQAWTPAPLSTPTDASAAAEALREATADAVARAQIATTPGKTWCEVSSGWDSTTVFALARKGPHAPGVFSWLRAHDEPGTDGASLRAVAREPGPEGKGWLGPHWHTLDPSVRPPFSHAPEMGDEPGQAIDRAKASAYALLREQHGVACVLTGMGGDITFGSRDVLPMHLADGVLSRNPWRLWRDLSAWSAGDARGQGRLHALRTLAWPLAQRARTTGELAPPAPWCDTAGMREALGAALPFDVATPAGMPFGRAALWREAFLLAALLAHQPGAARAHFRHPLLDRRLLELCLALPHAWRRTSAEDRVLQRRALRSMLPTAVATRRDKGTGQATLDKGLRDAMAQGPWATLLGNMTHLGGLGLIDAQAWRGALDRAALGVGDQQAALLIACECEAWLACASSAGLIAPTSAG